MLLDQGAPLSPFHRAVLMLMFLLLVMLGTRQVGSLDAGFHLKAGASILSDHGWPRFDSFTYTLNTHPYTDTSWGYQVLLALAYTLGGAPGMVVFHLLILIGIFVLLYKTARLIPVDPSTLVILLGAGILACEMRYDVRPELLSYLFLAALLHLLHRHALGIKTRLWLLPVLMGLWANAHALFVLGWVALACVIAGLWIRDRGPDKPLLLWSGAAFVAPLVNPYGLQGVLFPFTLLTRFRPGNAFYETISEFASPFALRLSEVFGPFYSHWPIWTFRLLAALLAPALILLVKQRRIWAVLPCLAFLPLEIRMIRNMPLLVITALPVMTRSLPLSGMWRLLRMSGRTARIWRNIMLTAAGALAVALGIRVATGAYYITSRCADRFGWSWNRLEVPVDAAEYIRRSAPPGPMLNHLNYGGYLMWAAQRKVFIDGRLEVAGEDFYRSYLSLFSSPDILDRAAGQYGFQWIIIPYTQEPSLLVQLSADPRWRLAHVDVLAAVFVRAGPQAAPCVDTASVEREAPPAASLSGLPGLGGPRRAGPLRRWLSGLISVQRYPQEAYSLGVFHFYRNEFSRAEAWFRAALEEGGESYHEVYMNLGSCLLRQHRYDEAAACYEVVLQDDPENRTAHDYLAAIARLRAAGG